MENQNHCKIRFICIQPYYSCKYYKMKNEFTGTCESDFVGECTNQEAKEEILKELKF